MYNGPHSHMKQQIVYKSLSSVSTGVACCFWSCLLTKFQFLTDSCLKPDIHRLRLCYNNFQWRNDIESSRLGQKKNFFFEKKKKSGEIIKKTNLNTRSTRSSGFFVGDCLQASRPCLNVSRITVTLQSEGSVFISARYKIESWRSWDETLVKSRSA